MQTTVTSDRIIAWYGQMLERSVFKSRYYHTYYKESDTFKAGGAFFLLNPLIYHVMSSL